MVTSVGVGENNRGDCGHNTEGPVSAGHYGGRRDVLGPHTWQGLPQIGHRMLKASSWRKMATGTRERGSGQLQGLTAGGPPRRLLLSHEGVFPRGRGSVSAWGGDILQAHYPSFPWERQGRVPGQEGLGFGVRASSAGAGIGAWGAVTCLSSHAPPVTAPPADISPRLSGAIAGEGALETEPVCPPHPDRYVDAGKVPEEPGGPGSFLMLISLS